MGREWGEESIKAAWQKIDSRNETLGFSRYDYADLDSHPLVLAIDIPVLRSFVRRVFRALDLFAPLAFHRFVGMPKTVVPTSFYHIGEAYLVLEDKGTVAPEATDDVCIRALESAISTPLLCWTHPYKAHADVYDVEKRIDVPLSCAHHTARLGLLLMDVGTAHGRLDFIDAARCAARALLQYHNWSEYTDGTCAVSYYPGTHDETINTCTDVAALLSTLFEASSDPMIANRLMGIVKMAIEEQQPTGAWLYCTRRHIEKEGNGGRCDCFHHAQVLQALSRIVHAGFRMSDQGVLHAAIGAGVRYLLDTFFDDSWNAYYFPGKKGLKAPIVAYSETLAAIWWIKKAGITLDRELASRLDESPSFLVEAAMRFLNQRTGDVASAIHFGRFYNIQSLRWGSGPLLEMLSYAIALDSLGIVHS